MGRRCNTLGINIRAVDKRVPVVAEVWVPAEDMMEYTLYSRDTTRPAEDVQVRVCDVCGRLQKCYDVNAVGGKWNDAHQAGRTVATVTVKYVWMKLRNSEALLSAQDQREFVKREGTVTPTGLQAD